ncbi:hypothetical protein [Luteolibacter marinus]|uniref:hypothetical protein n=1 Tax=Luteolibacter marinus TaxID=2776705 RepID=UPI001D02FA30|nr:hypothetical protein [Luteolibacter marinus]
MISGTPYRIVVGGTSMGLIDLDFRPIPPNDDFSNRSDLGSAAEFQVDGATIRATRGADDPVSELHPDYIGPNVWWSWTPPEDGIVRMNLAGSLDEDWVIGVYAGESLETLDFRFERQENLDLGEDSVFRVRAGEPLAVVAARDHPNSTGRLKMNWSLTPAPYQDLPQYAIDLGSAPTIDGSGNNVGASAEPGSNYSSVWWKWTAPDNGIATWRIDAPEDTDALGSAFDSELTKLSSVSAGKDARFYCRAEETYFLEASSPPDQQGDFDYHLSIETASPNDDVEDAFPLVMGPNPFVTSASSKEPGEPTGWSSWYGSLWWDWTSPDAGGLIINLEKLDFVKLVAFEVAGDGSLSNELESDDFLFLQTTAGARFLIGVVVTTSITSRHPSGTFDATFIPSDRGNDAFADAIDLGSVANSTVSGDPTNATVEAGEPAHNGGTPGRSLWWRWTAPAAGHLSALKWLPGDSGLAMSPDLRVYRGTDLSSLELFGSFGAVTAGEIIHFAATQKPDNSVEPVCFEFQFYEQNSNDALANAIELGSMEEFEFPVTLSGATYEADEPPHSSSGSFSLWWKWTAPADLNISTGLWNLSGKIENVDLYEIDAGGSPVLLPRHDVMAVDEGKTYYLSLFSASSRSGMLRVAGTTPPAGDRFAEPVDLGSVPAASLTVPSSQGTRESRDPTSILESGESFWWTWTAPEAGRFHMGAAGSTWQLLTESSPTLWTAVTWPLDVAAGQKLRIVGFRHASGNSINLVYSPIQPNDNRIDAMDLGQVSEISVSGQLRAATVEPDDNVWFAASPLDGSIWWTWVAPFDGVVKLRPEVSAGNTSMAFLSGPDAANVTLLATRQDDPESVFPVHQGERYWIMVGSGSSLYDTLTTLSLEAVETPKNDHWIGAIDLGSAERASGDGRNDRATLEEFEPTGIYGSLWWKWTAPRTGNAVVTAEIINGSEAIAIYRDLTGSNPVSIEAEDAGIPGTGKSVVFRTEAGATYYFSVAATLTGSLGKSVKLTVDFADPAPNDDFAAAAELTGTLPLSFSGTSGASTIEAGEPASGNALGSLWWKWTAPASGPVLATVEPSAIVSVFTGNAVDGLTLVGSNSSGKWISWQAQAGTTYYFQGAGDTGFSVALEHGTVPANDTFAAASDLGTTDSAQASGDNFFATAEAGEPSHAGTAAARSIWYHWTPVTSNRFEIDTRDSGRPMNVAVYVGSSPAGLTPVISGAGRVTFIATAGTDYRIAIDRGQGAPVSLALRPWSPPSNDNFANRTILGSRPFALIGDSYGASVETSEPLPSGGSYQYPRSLWWEWTAPVTGFVYLSTNSSAGGGALVRTFYSFNTSPAIGNLLLASQFSNPYFNASAGTTYYFQVLFDRNKPAAGVNFRIDGSYQGSSQTPDFGPPNDRFVDWTDIGQALGIEVRGDVYGSTLEAGQAGALSTGSIGWRWTAPSSGWFAIHRDPLTRPSLVRVLKGTTFSSLVTRASGNGEYLLFKATAGESLWIEWQSTYKQLSSLDRPERYSSFAIISSGGVPSNDNFATPIPLPAGLAGSVSGINADATAQAGEPDHAGQPATRSLWYQWTADVTGPVVLSASSATMRAGVYTGDTLNALDTVVSGLEPLEFDAVAGTDYRIALDSSTPSAFSVSLSTPAIVAPNDQFTDALPLEGTVGSVNGSQSGCSLQPGEPVGHSSSDTASTWWQWTAPSDGPVTWLADTASVNLGAYRGESLDSLQFVESGAQSMRFHAVSGETYWLAASSSSTDITYLLSWELENGAPANDAFSAATVLSGASVETSGSLSGSSREADEPWHHNSSARNRTVWYEWTAPASGAFRIELVGAATPDIWIYLGDSLATLQRHASGTRAFDFTASAGTTYRIAAVAKTEEEAIGFLLRIQPRDYGNNDLFANRMDLGNGTHLRLEGTTKLATREADELNPPNAYSPPEGTRWWSWTAPANGALTIKKIEPSAHIDIGIFTGNQLLELVEIEALPYSGDRFALPVTAGSSYAIQVGAIPLDFLLELEFTELDHDDFDDPLVLPSTLPISSEILATGASTQMGEILSSRSVWWQWTAPQDGWFDLDVRDSDFPATAWVSQGTSPSHITPVALDTSGDRIYRFFAAAGNTYAIAIGSTEEVNFGFARLTLSAPTLAAPANDHFASAVPLAGDAIQVSASSRGATTERDEELHLGSTHSRSLWWKWVAPRDGILFLSANPAWSRIYQGNSLANLKAVPALAGVAGNYPVVAGQSYVVAAGTSSGGEFSLKLSLSPPGDMFADAAALPSGQSVRITSTLSGCSFEEREPFHASRPAARSRWYRWKAGADGVYRISTEPAGLSLRLAVYRGSALTGLTREAAGTSSLLLDAMAATEYLIAVDDNTEGNSGEFTLTIDSAAYLLWSENYFSPPDAGRGSEDDPDGDGRSNQIELGLGSNPLVADFEPAFIIEATENYLLLQVDQPSDLEDWHLVFDVGVNLSDWKAHFDLPHMKAIENHGNGMQTLYVTLPGYSTEQFPHLFIRLRVEPGPDPEEP